MTQQISDLKRTIIEFDELLNYFIVRMTHEEAEEEIFKKDLSHFLEKVEEYKPVKVLWDLSLFDLTLDIELQAWIDENINKREIELGVLKEAFVMPEEFIVNLSVEQTMDEENAKIIDSEFFNEYNKALNWLVND